MNCSSALEHAKWSTWEVNQSAAKYNCFSVSVEMRSDWCNQMPAFKFLKCKLNLQYCQLQISIKSINPLFFMLIFLPPSSVSYRHPFLIQYLHIPFLLILLPLSAQGPCGIQVDPQLNRRSQDRRKLFLEIPSYQCYFHFILLYYISTIISLISEIARLEIRSTEICS